MRWPFTRAVVSGESMAPALSTGDHVLVRRTGKPAIGSVVVAEHPRQAGLLIVKRLTAGPGDTVYGAALARGEFWLASDNVYVAPDDSRSFGAVGAASIRGRVVLRYWPVTRSRRNGVASARESNT